MSILKALFFKKPIKQEKSLKVSLIKANDVSNDPEKRLVYGIVLIPETVDAHGDIISEDQVLWSAHNYMLYRYTGEQHREFADAEVVESYLAPVDFKLNDQDVKKGSWVICFKIISEDLWIKIKTGVYTAFSPAGLTFTQEL